MVRRRERPLDLGDRDARLEQTEVGEQGTNVRLPQQFERSEQRHAGAAADGNAVAHPGNPPFTVWVIRTGRPSS